MIKAIDEEGNAHAYEECRVHELLGKLGVGIAASGEAIRDALRRRGEWWCVENDDEMVRVTIWGRPDIIAEAPTERAAMLVATCRRMECGA